MSKMDGLRAMREAKYAEAAKRAGKPAVARTPPKAAAPGTTGTTRPTVSAEPLATAGELCGHRNMGGRTCTREHGHTAKSHRYS